MGVEYRWNSSRTAAGIILGLAVMFLMDNKPRQFQAWRNTPHLIPKTMGQTVCFHDTRQLNVMFPMRWQSASAYISLFLPNKQGAHYGPSASESARVRVPELPYASNCSQLCQR